MQTWTITAIDRLCGGCGQPISRRAPVLEIRIGRIGIYRCDRVKYRCEQCAGPAPPVLEAPIVMSEKPVPLEMTRIGLLSFEWKPPERKLVAAGDREPGEDDE